MIETSVKPMEEVHPSNPKSSSNKRKRPASSTPTKGNVVDLTEDGDDQAVSASPNRKKASPRKAQDVEKRLRKFRHYAPQTYLEKLHRATTQRMFVIDRTRGGTGETPEEAIDIAGTTGNIYNVNIGQIPTCTCPDGRKGNQCKHIIYVLHNVLKAPNNLQYQLAFISSELQQIFSAAPTSASEISASSSSPSNRKEVSGDCPICFTEFEPETEEILWCKAACGNNIHKDCFEQWAKSQKGKEVRCVYCRTPWQGDEDSLKRIKGKSSGKVNGEGYVNVAEELGLSGHRDYSTYNQFWVRRQGLGSNWD